MNCRLCGHKIEKRNCTYEFELFSMHWRASRTSCKWSNIKLCGVLNQQDACCTSRSNLRWPKKRPLLQKGQCRNSLAIPGHHFAQNLWSIPKSVDWQIVVEHRPIDKQHPIKRLARSILRAPKGFQPSGLSQPFWREPKTNKSPIKEPVCEHCNQINITESEWLLASWRTDRMILLLSDFFHEFF